jgi:hypothetical protein
VTARRALLALPALLLARCAPPQPVADDGGIGGTGLRAAGGDEGGIGGTGIFGTVTAAAGLAVNGLTLTTAPLTTIETLAGRPGPQPGEAVAAEAVRSGGRLLLSRVAVFHPLIGPLERTAAAGFAVLGTPLELAAAPAASPGEMVAVSGLWRGDSVVAGSVQPLGGPPRAVLRGLLRQRGNALFVGGSRLAARNFAAAPLERFVTVQGRPGAAGVEVESLDVRPLGVFAGRVGALSVEGFLAPNIGSLGFHLAGFGLPLDPASRILPRPGERQVFLGRFADTFRVATALPAPAAGAEAERAIAAWLAG